MSLKQFINSLVMVGMMICGQTSVHARLDTYETIRDNKIMNFSFHDVKGHKHHLKNYFGKIVIVNYWATWCRPCVQEMPSLNEIAKKYPDDVVVIALLKDKKQLETAKLFFERENLTKLVLCYDHNDHVARQLDIRGLPSTFIVNRQGYLIGKQIGGIEWDHIDVLTLIRSYVEGNYDNRTTTLKEKLSTILQAFDFDD